MIFTEIPGADGMGQINDLILTPLAMYGLARSPKLVCLIYKISQVTDWKIIQVKICVRLIYRAQGLYRCGLTKQLDQLLIVPG